MTILDLIEDLETQGEEEVIFRKRKNGDVEIRMMKRSPTEMLYNRYRVISKRELSELNNHSRDAIRIWFDNELKQLRKDTKKDGGHYIDV